MESNIPDLNSPKFLIDIHHKVHGYLQTYDYDGLVTYLTPYDDDTTNPNILKTILIAAKHDFIYKTSAGSIITKLDNRFDEIMHPYKYDVRCPYCKAGQEINHDDGYGYDEGVKHTQECYQCGKTFVFETEISFDYEVSKADCLNDGEHDYQPIPTSPKEYTQMKCVNCYDRRDPTDEERVKFSIPKVS
jgi:hypothetical protein